MLLDGAALDEGIPLLDGTPLDEAMPLLDGMPLDEGTALLDEVIVMDPLGPSVGAAVSVMVSIRIVR